MACSSLIVGFPHRPPAHGGPGTFQSHLMNAIRSRGHKIIFADDSALVPDVIVVVGGTKRLQWLWRCKRHGSKIVHRLDGINWRHRILPTNVKTQALKLIQNQLMRVVRDRFADYVVYQSAFARDLWHARYGRARCRETVIYNGTDLNLFRPRSNERKGKTVLLCVETNVMDDSATRAVLNQVPSRLISAGIVSEFHIYGGIPNEIRMALEKRAHTYCHGSVSRNEMPAVYQGASVYLSLDFNAACPNTVVEALASGVPVIGFDTGSLKELVGSDGGCVAPYGADPWMCESPDLNAIELCAIRVSEKLDDMSKSARCRAEKCFGMDAMVDSYFEVFCRAINA